MAEYAGAPPRAPIAGSITAIVIAFLAFVVTGFLVNLVTAVPVVALNLDSNPWIQTGKALASAGVGLWLGRRIADRVIGVYSRRLVFLAFAAIGVTVIVGGTLIAPSAAGTAVNIAGLVFVLAFAFLWFWRRPPAN